MVIVGIMILVGTIVFVGVLAGAAVALGSEAEPPPQAIRDIVNAKAATRPYTDQCRVGKLGMIIRVSLLLLAVVELACKFRACRRLRVRK